MRHQVFYRDYVVATLLNRTRYIGEHSVGIRADQSNGSDHEYQYYRQHHCVFGNVLTPIVFPKLKEKRIHTAPKLALYHSERLTLLAPAQRLFSLIKSCLRGSDRERLWSQIYQHRRHKPDPDREGNYSTRTRKQGRQRDSRINIQQRH